MAGTEVKNIIVALRGRVTASLGSAMSAGGKAVSGFVGSVKGLAAQLPAIGAGVAGAAVAAGAAVGALVMRTSAAMSATGKLADRLGTTTEALQGLRYAGGLAGASADVLDKSLGAFTVRLGQAQTAGGPMVDTLSRMGVPMADLAGLPVDQQLAKIADGFQGITDPAQRAAAAAQLFGEEGGAKMASMLSRGSAGMRQAMAEAESLGLTYSRSSAGAAEKFQGALTRLRAVFDGIMQQVAGNLLPYFERAAATLADWGLKAAPIISGMLGTAFKLIGDTVKAVATGFVTALTFVEAVAVNWKDSLDIVWKGTALGVVTLVEDIKYWFTTVAPAYLEWLGRNWGNIFTTISSFVSSVVTNMGKNLQGFFKAVQDWLGGKGFTFQWTGLTEGFKSTLEELPRIAARQKTALEQQLSRELGQALDKVGAYFNKKLAERLAWLNPQGGGAPSAGPPAEEAGRLVGKELSTGVAKGLKAALAGGANALGTPGGEFGILGARQSLRGLAGAGGRDPQMERVALNTGSSAKSLSLIAERVLAKAPNTGAATFAG